VISTSAFYDLPKSLIKEINMIVAQYGVKVMLNNRSENNNWLIQEHYDDMIWFDEFIIEELFIPRIILISN
jgi:hypothetical protein